MKIQKKSDTSTFMTPGTWNFTKMRQFDFLQLSWTIKILKNQTIQFSSIFMTPGTWKSSKNQKLWFYSIFKKIEGYDFCGFSCTRVHEMSCTPWGQVANELDWIFRFCKISIGPGTWNLKKKLNTRSNLIPPFKLPVKKKLILKVSLI